MIEQAMDELILLAKTKKEYTRDSIMIIMGFCCSKQMHDSGFTSEQALKKAKEFIESGLSKAEVYSEILKLTGYEA